jgi:ferredoxin
MKPGYGGWWPGDPTAPTFKVTVKSSTGEDIHTLDVPRDRFIYSYFEENGVDLPVKNPGKMCRQGCCTTCAAKVESGRVVMDNPLGLLREMRQEGYVLTCSSCPRSDVVLRLQDEDEVYKKQWGKSFEGGGVEWGGFLPEDD